ncbi:hypothetical protein QE443_002613 [Pantoea ananatis]|jgi:hypothetical protein|nr:hypothetical protein [Pantoea ananatis]MDR6088330.1 hypothetical protein [Pantoea ananatis]
MSWGFGTWDAAGRDNNTGLVKINAVGTMQFDSNYTGTQSFYLPSGYSLSYLHQAGGNYIGRMRITISGNSVTISSVANDDYSSGTLGKYQMNFVVVYAR